MSKLVSVDGTVKNYVIADSAAKLIVAARNSFGEANVYMSKLNADGAEGLVLHNITHSSCPDWLMGLVREDRFYCSARAASFVAHAKSLRQKANDLLSQADEMEASAVVWRGRSDPESASTEASSSNAPKF